MMVILIFVNYTFSRYITTVDSTGSISTVAKFNVEVNNVKLGEAQKFEIGLTREDTSKVYDNKIAPGTNGYFEIVINPAQTKVALDYSITLKVTQDDFKVDFTEYSINGGEKVEIPDDDKIYGEIPLNSTSEGFTDSDKKTIRIYWNWDQDITNPTFIDTKIQASVIVAQKID